MIRYNVLAFASGSCLLVRAFCKRVCLLGGTRVLLIRSRAVGQIMTLCSPGTIFTAWLRLWVDICPRVLLKVVEKRFDSLWSWRTGPCFDRNSNHLGCCQGIED